ncbi:MAG TPA: nucleotide pyrophosphohydrolase [Pseudogracilibacillus sp.]|nr:nucleotide pyrophosphohydrolase [Pseudogracilibacillus sp.]
MKNLQQDIIQFVEKRNWTNNQDIRNLAISINLEASELLEHFQWCNAAEAIRQEKDEIAEEAADILIYLLQFAHYADFDLQEAVKKKLAKNEQRFPIHS